MAARQSPGGTGRGGPIRWNRLHGSCFHGGSCMPVHDLRREQDCAGKLKVSCTLPPLWSLVLKSYVIGATRYGDIALGFVRIFCQCSML